MVGTVSTLSGAQGTEQFGTQRWTGTPSTIVSPGVVIFSAPEISRLETPGNANESPKAKATGIISSKNPSLKPAAKPECSGFSEPSARPLVVENANKRAVPMLPPRKNNIEFMLRAEASISPLTSREMVAANGVFTNPNPAPISPANIAMIQGEYPEYADRPNRATSITNDPIRTGILAPERSVRRPDSSPPPR